MGEWDLGAGTGDVTSVNGQTGVVVLTSPEVQAQGPVFNVKDPAYGAIGNGIADDSVAIQAALNAVPLRGGTVYFPDGQYYIGTGLTLATAGTVLQGEGNSGQDFSLAPGTVEIIVGDGIWGLTVGSPSTGNFRGCGINQIQFYEKNTGKALGGVRAYRTGNGRYQNFSIGQFAQSVATTFTGGTAALSTLGTLPLAALTSGTGWFAGGGSGRILATDGWHGFTYTGISGTSLTGCVYMQNTSSATNGTAVVADVGIGFLLDGRVNGLTGDAPYNNFLGCSFGTVGSVAFQEYSANGTSFDACQMDGSHNGTIAPVAGSIGVLAGVGAGDSFSMTGGTRVAGYDTLIDLPANNSHNIDNSTRFEYWNTVAVHLRGSGNSSIGALVGGRGDNSLIGSLGTGVIIDAGAVGAIVEARFSNVATVYTDNGTGTIYPFRVPIPDAQAYNDMLGWSVDWALAATGTALPAAATLYLMRVPLPQAISVTNVLYHLTTVANNTLTHCFVAVFRSDGTIVGQTADQATVWETGGTIGLKSVALAGGPFTVSPLAANDFLWVGFYVGTATGSLPAFMKTTTGNTADYSWHTSVARTRIASIAQADTATLASITPSGLGQATSVYTVGIT